MSLKNLFGYGNIRNTTGLGENVAMFVGVVFIIIPAMSYPFAWLTEGFPFAKVELQAPLWTMAVVGIGALTYVAMMLFARIHVELTLIYSALLKLREQRMPDHEEDLM